MWVTPYGYRMTTSSCLTAKACPVTTWGCFLGANQKSKDQASRIERHRRRKNKRKIPVLNRNSAIDNQKHTSFTVTPARCPQFMEYPLPDNPYSGHPRNEHRVNESETKETMLNMPKWKSLALGISFAVFACTAFTASHDPAAFWLVLPAALFIGI